MTSLKQQTEAKVAAGRQANPDFMKGIDDVIEQAKAFQQGGNALAVGQQVPAFVLNHMKVDRQLDLESINNGNGSVLPIPATFVIGTDGVVSWRYVDVDYRTRSEPDNIIEALKKLSA